jgi:DNA polymerase elongation subunit (family B)
MFNLQRLNNDIKDINYKFEKMFWHDICIENRVNIVSGLHSYIWVKTQHIRNSSLNNFLVELEVDLLLEE